ncbi:hypothetical protein Pelo_19853 [Pelomyxa schiedti]|nr:hypothetical protein Pelo_19853 [Pelomyxa schiedti]
MAGTPDPQSAAPHHHPSLHPTESHWAQNVKIKGHTHRPLSHNPKSVGDPDQNCVLAPGAPAAPGPRSLLEVDEHVPVRLNDPTTSNCIYNDPSWDIAQKTPGTTSQVTLVVRRQRYR